jgi:hypothetical protein
VCSVVKVAKFVCCKILQSHDRVGKTGALALFLAVWCPSHPIRHDRFRPATANCARHQVSGRGDRGGPKAGRPVMRPGVDSEHRSCRAGRRLAVP